MLDSTVNTRMHRSDLDDTTLIERFKAGEKSAFNLIYDRYCPLLYRSAERILDDADLAKDIVQEAFISLFEKADEADIRNLQAYLVQTVRYRCFMELRAGKIAEKHIERISVLSTTNNLEEELDAKELQSVVDETIAALPDKCREVFYLSRYESLSNKKIAERLNISHKTVENQITKALKILHLSIGKASVIGVCIATHYLAKTIFPHL